MQPREYSYAAADTAATDRFAAALAAALPAGVVVALEGTLGAGKTRLVQGIAGALGVPRENVVSPTFVLCQQYNGSRTIYHLDAYRLADDDEFLELGPQEMFDAGGLTFIEWAEKVERCLPPEHVRIDIQVIGETSRQFRVTAVGDSLAQVLLSLEQSLATSDPA